MELTTYHTCPTQDTMYNSLTGLSIPERYLPRVMVDVGAKCPSLETLFVESIITIREKTDPSFMERLMAGNTVVKASEDVTGNDVESDFKKKETGHVSDTLDVVRRTNVEVIVESLPTKWINTLKSMIIKAVENTFEDPYQTSYIS